MQSPVEQQRAVNTASGYNFVAWATLSLTWLALLLNAAIAMLFACMAVVASLLGLARCANTRRGKFLWLPLLTLAYLALCAGYGTVSPFPHYETRFQIALAGMLLSAATLPLIVSIARRDFAKTLPAWVCRSCGYTLLGLRDDTCPECGQAFDIERIPSIGPGQRDGQV